MSRFAYSIFCDDVRHELNGKTSLMGVYQGVMYLPSFPAHLPKMCVLISAVTPAENPFRSVIFKVYMDSKILFEIPISAEQIEEAKAGAPNLEEPRFQRVQTMGIFSPIAFVAPCRIRIEVEADEEVIECAGLHVLKAPEGMQIIG